MSLSTSQHLSPTVAFHPSDHQQDAGAYERHDDQQHYSTGQDHDREDGPRPSKLAKISVDAPRDDQPKSKKKRTSAVGSASSRTGQACDRCKHRKIRCDNTPGGCMPCRQNHTECKTTDRNTNTARVRGHTEVLEQQASFLHQHIAELHDQLRELGANPRNNVGYTGGDQTYAQWKHDQAQWAGVPQQANQMLNHNQYAASQELQTSDGTIQAANLFTQHTRTTSAPSTSSMLSSDELTVGIGQPLTIFGIQIDLTKFVGSNDDSPRGFNTMFNLSTKPQEYRADLPPYQQGKQQVQAYLSICNTWQPLLHGPDVSQLVENMYKHGYEGTPAEKVIVHVAMANILYQTASRNAGTMSREAREELDRQSDRHYHYTCGFATELLRNRTLEDVQALAMLCLHLRSFPDSYAANLLLSATFWSAIESKLHRSAKSLPEHERPTDVKTIEIRKRVFWSLLMMYVPVCGKLGHPMPLGPQDFDIELPEPLNDNLQPAEDGWAEGKCRFFHAIAFMKLSKLYLEMYRTVYACHPSQNYDMKVQEFDAKLRNWKENDWPAILKGPIENFQDPAHRVMAIWLKWWSIEFQHFLYHPTRLRLDSSQQVPQKALDTSVTLATELIQSSVMLWREQALDTTWGNSLSFLSAIFTLLFCLDQREQIPSTSDLAKLRGDLETCLKIIVDIGSMLGSGPQLRDRMKQIIDTVFDRIKGRHSQRIASAAVAKANTKSPTSRVLQDQLPLKMENTSSSHTPHSGSSGQYTISPDSSSSSATEMSTAGLSPAALDALTSHTFLYTPSTNHSTIAASQRTLPMNSNNPEYVHATSNIYHNHNHHRSSSTPSHHQSQHQHHQSTPNPTQLLSHTSNYQQASDPNVTYHPQYDTYTTNTQYQLSPSDQNYLYTHSPNPNTQYQAVGVGVQSPNGQVDSNASWNHFPQNYLELEPANALMALSGTHGDGGAQVAQQGYGGLIPAGMGRSGQQWPEGTWSEERGGE